MTWTFSTLVDSCVAELQRPDKRNLIESSLNGAIRDLHMYPVDRYGTAPVKFSENLVELIHTIGPSEPYGWAIPNQATFMAIEAIRYADRPVFFSERKPNTMRRFETDFAAQARYYRSGSQIVLDEVYPGQQVYLSYYTYLPRLTYIVPELRAIQWSDDEETFVNLTTMLPASEAEVAKETNWALTRHAECLRAGVKAKVYLALGNTEVGKIHYASFETGRTAVQSSEATG